MLLNGSCAGHGILGYPFGARASQFRATFALPVASNYHKNLRGKKIMRLRKILSCVASCLFLALAATSAQAEQNVKLEPFITGVNAPLAMVQAPGDDRFFIIEQWGRIRIANKDGSLEAEPFLDIRHRIPVLWPDFDERGLLGLAFHPDYQKNGKFYVAYSAVLDPESDLGK